MTKEEMRAEIKFPVLITQPMTYVNMHTMTPVPNAWIACYSGDAKYGGLCLYKWQESGNPDVHGWTYIDINASFGTQRFVEYPHLSHDKLILICDEADSHLVINQ